MSVLAFVERDDELSLQALTLAQSLGDVRAVTVDGEYAPAAWAAAIVAALDADEPPLRLALGSDAVDAIRAKHERLRVDLDTWEAVARATAFDA